MVHVGGAVARTAFTKAACSLRNGGKDWARVWATTRIRAASVSSRSPLLFECSSVIAGVRPVDERVLFSATRGDLFTDEGEEVLDAVVVALLVVVGWSGATAACRAAGALVIVMDVPFWTGSRRVGGSAHQDRFEVPVARK
ncbi:MAG: hypothetical protein J0I40_10910 [Cellulomonas sp.]|uniref:hypothetical protein n=1 Tax=Cellulomonas sp. 73-92 TaxID=1895740 RepID=UPI00092933E2|nr:hypothetical protein [Cellulomonas sp. 73-92]MBN9375878.1 hypothetical protein [Cellulomonas sp.]OJV81571.1 MAG: hypothetical protein BGO37_06485 [Cellulomonas sp. 73-92]